MIFCYPNLCVLLFSGAFQPLRNESLPLSVNHGCQLFYQTSPHTHIPKKATNTPVIEVTQYLAFNFFLIEISYLIKLIVSAVLFSNSAIFALK